MKSALRVLSLLPLLATAQAAAAPSFKQAPGGDKGGGGGEGGGAFDFSLDLGLDQYESLQPVLQFLGDYYGYLGVVFVLLVLFLFARGSGDDEDVRAGAVDGEDDFFEPADAERFRKGR